MCSWVHTACPGSLRGYKVKMMGINPMQRTASRDAAAYIEFASYIRTRPAGIVGRLSCGLRGYLRVSCLDEKAR